MLQAAGRGKAARAAFTERQARQIAAAYYKLFSEAWPYSVKRIAYRLDASRAIGKIILSIKNGNRDKIE
ncbi:hypothetical protein LSG25_02300 [Paralcaligenes sp. KSB-10]|uniref:hypothetical protein n=1 Tax=Paralcaligenes sp. KSB-10 TaxID=2901142 RepID=UPI001E487E26|nr:hypothetical protein [Paralcaligenes sp. KSB-10]UHL64759.1 hypothetical protein LSG25_02300 [Paralcaligenes sp. KSB-10]